MTNPAQALQGLPLGLRDPLLQEYRSIVQNFLERRWSPAELSGGLFCEIVYTIVDGYGKKAYASGPTKPADFVSACRRLESVATVPRSFQILIPRLLPALYEIRNNRGVGHVGGDVDPNHMDAVAVLSMANWVMAELIRVIHGVSIVDAQALVDAIAERRVPLVWEGKGMKRVLDPTLPLSDQLLLLVASAAAPVASADLLKWSGYSKQAYFLRLLRRLHAQRLIEFDEVAGTVQILPPGSSHVEKLVRARMPVPA